MKKIVLPALAILCSLGLAACSSSSSGGSANKVDKQEYEILKSEVTDLNSTLSELESTLQKLQNRLASSQSASKSEIEKLEAKLAEAKGNEAKTAELVAELDAQLKNAIQAATVAGDQKLAEALAKSQEEVNAIKKQAEEAAKKANEATNDAQKAKEEAEKAQAEAEKAKNDAAKTQEELNKAKEEAAAVEARTPVSDKIFGGSSGKMVAVSGKLSGGVLVKDQDGKVLSIDAPDTREGISYITVVDDRGQTVDVGIDAVYTGWKSNLGGASRWDHSGAKVRYGVYSEDRTGKGYVYSQGQATELANMPKQGEFTYLGNVGQAVFKYGSWDADTASAYAQINFADKTARIELNTELAATKNDRSVNTRVTPYTFDGKITENSIAGVANEDKEVKMQAGFFGEDAKYLSGIYQSDKVQGVFGVTKQ
ncbi:TPA: transferrin-binding protein-like solute binding protein [Mannheimia haemolytica]